MSDPSQSESKNLESKRTSESKDKNVDALGGADEDDDDKSKKAALTAPSRVIVHPLVLLSVVDHYNRVAKDVDKDSKKRVCGILLGDVIGTKVDVTNSYAVPFEEDTKNPQTWWFDHNYHESMFAMFKKVNASERVVGWYSSGPLIRPNDIEIHEVVRRYCAQPVFVIVDVKPEENTEIPTKAYYSIPVVPGATATTTTTAASSPSSASGTSSSSSSSSSSSGAGTYTVSTARREFVHLPSEIGAEEAEEVGVEHLLREIKEIRISSITDVVGQKLSSLKALDTRMHEMVEYLDNVCKGVMPPNPKIIYSIQELLNLCPDMGQAELARAFAVKTHNNLLVLYMASLTRSITALHDLINNKFLNRAAEKSEEEKRALLAATRSVTEESDAPAADADPDDVHEGPGGDAEF